MNQENAPPSDEDEKRTLSDDQRCVFDAILSSVLEGNSASKRLHFIQGPSGSGITYLLGQLARRLEKEGKSVRSMAFYGPAATLLPEGKTVHSIFRHKDQAVQEGMAHVDVLIWDAISVVPHKIFESIHQRLVEITGQDEPFGGKTVILGGDFRQLLPLLIHKPENPVEKEKSIVELSLIGNDLLAKFTVHRLHTIKRILEEDPADPKAFERLLSAIADGTAKAQELEPFKLSFPGGQEKKCPFFGDKCRLGSDDGVILCPSKRVAEVTNNRIIDSMPGELWTNEAVDTHFDECFAHLEEIFAAMPPKHLKLKPGCVVTLARNQGNLSIGSRLVVEECRENEILCRALTTEQQVSIAAQDCEGFDEEDRQVRRRQFPVLPFLATTVHKALGLTFNKVLILKADKFHAHGQLYVAMSRVRSRENVRICCEGEVKNIVYKAAVTGVL